MTDGITAGWYTDSDGAIRWWDGARWTEHVRDDGEPEPTVVLPAETSARPRAEPEPDEPDHRRRTMLIATFVGLLAFFLGMAIGGNGNSPDPAVVDEATASSGATAEQLDKRESDLKTREDELTTKQKDLEQRSLDLEARESASPGVPSDSGAGTIGNGVFEVGTDVDPGQYTSEGPDDAQLPCTYKVSTDEAGDQIVSSKITHSTGTITLTEGQFFTSQYCKTWTLQ
jgi:Protein of unknown function (DUF2510)